MDNKDKQSNQGWLAAIIIILIIFSIAYNIQQNASKDNYQNALDWTACRRDYKNGLATMDECNQVKRNDSVYVPR